MNSGWGIIIPYKFQVAGCLSYAVEKDSNYLRQPFNIQNFNQKSSISHHA